VVHILDERSDFYQPGLFDSISTYINPSDLLAADRESESEFKEHQNEKTQ